MLFASAGRAQAGHPAPEGRSWTIADSITTRYYANAGFHAAGLDPILWSPSRKYFAFITYRGDPSTDSVKYELSIYATSAVEQWLGNSRLPPPLPFRVVRMGLDHFTFVKPAIANLRWTADETKLFFVGGEHGPMQVYELDLATGRLIQRTRTSSDVLDYVFGARALIFVDQPEQRAHPATYPGELTKWRASDDGSNVMLGRPGHWVEELHTSLHIAGRDTALTFPGPVPPDMWVSPDDRFAVLLTNGYPQKFMLLDLHTAKLTTIASRGLFGGAWPEVRWARDGSRALIINAVATEAAKPGPAGDVLSLNVRSGQVSTVVSLSQGDHVVDGDGNTLTIELGSQAKVYTYHNGGWSTALAKATTTSEPSRTVQPALDVQVAQSANEPSRVVARLEGREGTLVPEDSRLNGIWRAQLTPFRWRDADGKEIEGGLYLPRGFQRGHPVPLVIQADDWRSDIFLPDGPNPTVDASQLLAARGIAVLDYSNADISGLHDARRAQARMEAAVGALADAGFVDPSRVAQTGFSRMGYFVYYAITHPGRIRLAAAIAADNYKGAWASDIFDSGRKGHAPLSQATGAYFFRGGDDRAHALEEDTTLNVANSKTPILFTQHGYGRTLDIGPDIFETIGAFMQARRPIDFAYLPEATHNIQRPRERSFMLGLTVDWLSFWLQGDEDPDPAKADQYKRWRALRTEWKQQQEWEAAGNPIGSKPRLAEASSTRH